MSDYEEAPSHEGAGIKDSLGHEIPPQELNPRHKETSEVLELLRENPLIILTSEGNCYGKSTFARILRHRLNAETAENESPKCIYQDISRVSIHKTSPRYHDSYDQYDDVSYPDLQRFKGVAIFDEVHFDQFRLLTTLEESWVIAIVQPVFLEGPIEDELHQKFHNYIRKTQTPTYWLPSYMAPDDT